MGPSDRLSSFDDPSRSRRPLARTVAPRHGNSPARLPPARGRDKLFCCGCQEIATNGIRRRGKCCNWTFPNKHLSFGMGPQRVSRSHLAKLMIKVADRKGRRCIVGDFSLADPEGVRWAMGEPRGTGEASAYWPSYTGTENGRCCDRAARRRLVLVLEINRARRSPQRRVRGSPGMTSSAALPEARERPGHPVLVLCGPATGAFSAGWDMNELAQMSEEEQHTRVQLDERNVWQWASTPIPTVVALCKELLRPSAALLAVTADLRAGCTETDSKSRPPSKEERTSRVLDGADRWSRTKDLRNGRLCGRGGRRREE